MITVDNVKIQFLDKRTLTETRRSVMRGFARVAAYTRAVARNSIKRGKKGQGVSKPGRPPFSRTGLLKKHIYFWQDWKNQSVQIGPARLAGTASQDIPGALEEGGFVDGARIGARPYMQPALDKAKSRLSTAIRAN